jgi:putative YD repeat-containing domain protein
VDGLPLKRTHFVWDGTRLLQEYTYKGSYTYIYTDQDSYEPLDQVFHNNQDEAHYLSYFHNDQIDIPREMTDIHGNLVWLELHFDPDLLNRITRVMGAMSEGVRKELERWEFCVE